MTELTLHLCDEGWRLWDELRKRTEDGLAKAVHTEEWNAYFNHRRNCSECTDPKEVEDV